MSLVDWMALSEASSASSDAREAKQKIEELKGMTGTLPIFVTLQHHKLVEGEKNPAQSTFFYTAFFKRLAPSVGVDVVPVNRIKSIESVTKGGFKVTRIRLYGGSYIDEIRTPAEIKLAIETETEAFGRRMRGEK